MQMDIYPIPLGFDRGYMIKGEGTVMIDAGPPGKAKAFRKGIQKASARPADIGLLILTHGHWDHAGSAKSIQDITGAKIVMHEKEREWLERALKPLPPAVTPWGRVLAAIIRPLVPLVDLPPAKVDVVLEDAPFSLVPFGIDGKILPTPGHSPGSVSVVLSSGEAFVGDLAMNAPPLRLNPGPPIFAEDMEAVRDSWKRLLEAGATKIYPAHGRPFSASRMRRFL